MSPAERGPGRDRQGRGLVALKIGRSPTRTGSRWSRTRPWPVCFLPPATSASRFRRPTTRPWPRSSPTCCASASGADADHHTEVPRGCVCGALPRVGSPRRRILALDTLVAGSAFAAPEHGAGPLRRLVLFTAILVGCAAALQPLAAAATQAALFGMVEVRAASYVALPQWVRVMHGMARDEAVIRVCTNDRARCPIRPRRRGWICCAAWRGRRHRGSSTRSIASSINPSTSPTPPITACATTGRQPWNSLSGRAIARTTRLPSTSPCACSAGRQKRCGSSWSRTCSVICRMPCWRPTSGCDLYSGQSQRHRARAGAGRELRALLFRQRDHALGAFGTGPLGRWQSNRRPAGTTLASGRLRLFLPKIDIR